METIEALVSMLGEDNCNKIKNKVTQLIIDNIEKDLDERDSYIIPPDIITDFLEDCREEAFSKIKSKIVNKIVSDISEKFKSTTEKMIDENYINNKKIKR